MPVDTPYYRIGEAAKLSGISTASIRYYEREGLLAPRAREGNSYRLYNVSDVHALRFIRLCRSMDMSLDEVRTLLALQLGRREDCLVACKTLDAHVGHVRERLKELRALERDLQSLRAHCDGHEPSCTIVEALHRRADAQANTIPAPQRHRHV